MCPHSIVLQYHSNHAAYQLLFVSKYCELLLCNKESPVMNMTAVIGWMTSDMGLGQRLGCQLCLLLVYGVSKNNICCSWHRLLKVAQCNGALPCKLCIHLSFYYTLHCLVDYFNSPHPHSTKPFPSSTLPPTQLPAGSENTTTIYAASSAAVLVFVVTILVVIACLVVRKKRAHGRQRYVRLQNYRTVVDL